WSKPRARIATWTPRAPTASSTCATTFASRWRQDPLRKEWERKRKTSNSKSQIPKKVQTQKSEVRRNLGFEACSFSGAWDLEFGAFLLLAIHSFHPHLQAIKAF